ncbi:tryptophanyl-tRNA synthetase [Aspergillus fumigatus Z5]|nr:tryptophanyl-tRNA synthetase [Aspergillus fumigatus Z5]
MLRSKNSAPSSGSGVKEWSERLDSVGQKARLPRSVQALYLRPLRRKPEFGLPVCDLQLRSYSVRNLEFFADFALRAAYYLELPVSGPVPLPRIVERWTFPRSNFVHKKSQENFERITLRRLIQIKDGHPQAVQAWLAFLRKHAFYGVDVARNMDESLPDIEKSLEPYLSHFGYRSDGSDQSAVFDLLEKNHQANAIITRISISVYRLDMQRSNCHSSQVVRILRGARRPRIRAGKPVTSREVFRRWSSSETAKSSSAANQTIFSGIQPTGVPHLGNYLGALREWVRLQNAAKEGTRLFFSIVDLHALTVPQDASQLRNWRKETFATLIAVGLDPNRSTIFYQSAVHAHAELFWILCTIASMGYLSRMTQWKAADILVHRATHVPVGDDQRQHLEFSRNTANSFNHVYGPIFPSPEAIISPAKRVMSLKEPTLKMSKSHADRRSRIILTDSPAEISKKINAALTDSELTITYDPVRRPGVANLIEILSHFDGRTCDEIAMEYRSASLRALKEHLARTLSNHLEPIREKYLSLVGDQTDYLDSIAEQGSEAARANAELTMEQVKVAMGLI